MTCNSCKKYLVLSDMEAVGLCVHCLALAGKDKRIAELEAQLAELEAQVDKDSIMLKEYHYLISDETLSLNDKLIRFDSLDEEVKQWAEAKAKEEVDNE